MNKLTTVEKLDKKQIEDFFSEALNIEKTWPNLKKVGENKTICLFFWEPSTRTKLSFEHAAKALGFNVLDFSPSLSSVQKGESLEDTLNTLISLKIDGLVMRHPENEISEQIAKLLPKEVFFINAGDGNHAHPTQGLLDAFTISKLKNISDSKVAIIGDVKHSRVIPSLFSGLKKMDCTQIEFFGPKELIPSNFTPQKNDITENCLEGFDFLYVLRIQNERFLEDENLDLQNYIKNYQVNDKFLEFTKFDGKIMHPGPVNLDYEITKSVSNSNNSIILDQVENGLYLRAGILSLLIG